MTDDVAPRRLWVLSRRDVRRRHVANVTRGPSTLGHLQTEFVREAAQRSATEHTENGTGCLECWRQAEARAATRKRL